MRIENFNIEKLCDSLYGNEIQKADNEIVYCELQYQRDKSSFAGVALKISNNANIITIRKCEENIQNIGKYEKMYIGYEQDYIKSIKKIFSEKRREYGIDIIFLVYSSVRSCPIIFGEITKKIDKNIDIIKKIAMI